ncbi:MAG: ATP phosphoribosyltransferase regulatory subunit [Clostridia bacterium]|nr:ATP phosphoribosyltransferase regulatory subunit [Clostridia bacterium]
MIIDEALLKYDEESVFKLRSLYQRFGYSRYKMGKFEEYDLYVRNKDFLISDSVITFTDTNGRLRALKPDVTLSIINNCKDVAGQVQKVYYNENVYRISGSSHNYKEIMQTGLECIGDITLYDKCEVVLLALLSLEIIDENCILEVSHIGFLKAVLDCLFVNDEHKKEVIELISSKNVDGIAEFCKNGAYSENAEKVLKLFCNSYNIDEAVKEFSKIAEGEAAKNEFDEFSDILSVLKNNGNKNIVIDFSSVNGMRYYSGIVFKGYINGIPDSVCSGGQYDKLMRKMNRDASAIGFAVYLDALERFKEKSDLYDVDTVLLCGEDICLTFEYAKKLSADGISVRVCKSLPENLRYRRVLRLFGKELVTENEND